MQCGEGTGSVEVDGLHASRLTADDTIILYIPPILVLLTYHMYILPVCHVLLNVFLFLILGLAQ